MNRHDAWRACQSRLALRLCGQSPVAERTTNFDVQSVVDAVYWDDHERKRAIQAGFAATHQFDSRLFDQLKKSFESAWLSAA